MITLRQNSNVGNTDLQTSFKSPKTDIFCKSTDTKPTNVPNGTTLTEIDTGDTYIFSAATDEWLSYTPVPHIRKMSGSVVNFNGNGTLLDSLKAAITAVQNLNGYANPWPAGGGVNKFDEVTELGSISDTTGEDTPSTTTLRSKNYIPCQPNTQYYVAGPNINFAGARFYDTNKAFISALTSGNTANKVITTPADCYYIRLSFTSAYGTTYSNDIAINYPSSVTTYSPYANICPISGFTGVNAVRAGKNLIDDSKYYRTNAQVKVFGQTDNTTFKTYLKAGTYIASIPNYSSNTSIWYQSATVAATNGGRIDLGDSFNIPEDGYYRIWVYSPGSDVDNITKLQLELGSTATAYEAYDGDTYSVTWQDDAGTVYSGTVNIVSGVLTVTHVMIDVKSATLTGGWGLSDDFCTLGVTVTGAKSGETILGSIRRYSATGMTWRTWTINSTTLGVSFDRNVMLANGYDGSTAASLRTAAAAYEASLADGTDVLVYALATPATYQLDPTTVRSLVGQNNVWADTGDIVEAGLYTS